MGSAVRSTGMGVAPERYFSHHFTKNGSCPQSEKLAPVGAQILIDESNASQVIVGPRCPNCKRIVPVVGRGAIPRRRR